MMPQTTPASHLVVAPLMLRVFGIIIDLLLVGVVNILLFTILGVDFSSAGRESIGLASIGQAVYFTGFTIGLSTTPGKMAVGLYIGDRQGRRIRPDTAILRYLVFMIGGLLLFGWLISIVLIFTDPQRRALHDRIAGTLVLLGRPPPERAWE